MAEVEQNSSKKKVSELRVIDLRCELEKRGLDKTGVKTALIERLTKAIEEEGHNPEEYFLEVALEKTPTKVPVKRSSRKAKENETENDEEEEEEKQDEDDGKEELNEEDPKEVENGIEKNLDSEAQQNAQCNGSNTEDVSSKESLSVQNSPPKPELAPVVVPLTVEDLIKLDTSSKIKRSDNDSLVVNPDDIQSDIDSSVIDEPMQEEGTENSVQLESSLDCKVSKNDEDSSIEDASLKVDDSVAIIYSSEKVENSSTDTPPVVTQPESPKSREKPSEKDSVEKTVKKSGTTVSNDNVKRVAASSKNLWVSGLAEKTRANDLRSLFNKHGKVTSAKIVTNAKTPGARCYGFITMASSEEATACIEKLNRTELHGRIITVEKTTREPSGTIKRADLKAMKVKGVQQKKTEAETDEENVEAAKSGTTEGTEKDATDSKAEKAKTAEKAKSVEKTKSTDKAASDEKCKDDEEKKEGEDSEGRKEGKKGSFSKDRSLQSRDRSRERKRRERKSRSRDRTERVPFRGGYYRRGYGRGFGTRRPFMSSRNFVDHFSRERSRSRDRDLDRRRYSDNMRQKEIERRNRDESNRLERERERLRIEREKLERDRAEVLRLEREKQHFEREKLERERAELRKRTQMTLGDRRGSKRMFDSPRKDDTYWDDRKRGRRESPEPDRFNDRGLPDRHLEGRGKGISNSFSRHEENRSGFHRSGGINRNATERGSREEGWKGAKGANRNGRPFDRRGTFGGRPHPWEGEGNRSQWAPLDSGKSEAWGRLDQPQARWSVVDHGRGAQAANVAPGTMGLFQPGNDMVNQMAGHFSGERFNSNVLRRF